MKKIPNLENLAVIPSWVHFMNKDGVIFSSRLIAEEFPSDTLRKFFDHKDDLLSYQFPKGLEKALERADILSYEKENGMNYVTLKEQKGKLLIKGERQYGSINERLPLEGLEWPHGVKLDILPKYLLDILSKTRTFQE